MKTIHGTTRANFNNMVVGVSEGFQKALELIGVGYRAQLQGSKLVLNVGYSHPVEITPPAGVTVEVPANTQVIVKGANKEEVGELAANIRGTRPQNLIKVKVFVMLANMYAVKKVKLVNNRLEKLHRSQQQEKAFG